MLTQEQDNFQLIQNRSNFQITPCEGNINFDGKEHYEKLKLNTEQKEQIKMQISELQQHIPAVAAAETMARAYTVKFPQGLPHTLISLKQGGFGSSITDNGKIVGSASFYPMTGQAAFLGIFTAMSIATGQFFLTQINKQLSIINMKLDEILQFLYGEKRAELLSEVDFVKYARDNYISIMKHEAQRIATIANIQEAKKVAMKDIEFYMSDLSNLINSCKKDFKVLANLLDNEIKRAKNNLDLSMQLYFMSNLLEVHYAQNYEEDYISQLKSNIEGYLGSCNRQICENYAKLEGYFDCCYVAKNEKQIHLDCKDKIKEIKETLQNEKYNIPPALIQNKNSEYYITTEGSVYYKVS